MPAGARLSLADAGRSIWRRREAAKRRKDAWRAALEVTQRIGSKPQEAYGGLEGVGGSGSGGSPVQIGVRLVSP
jgi:hypothetical protein